LRVSTPDGMQNRPDSPIRASAPDGRENRPDTHPLQDSYQHRTTARVGFASYRFRTNAKVGPAPHPLQDSYECQTDTRTGRALPSTPKPVPTPNTLHRDVGSATHHRSEPRTSTPNSREPRMHHS